MERHSADCPLVILEDVKLAITEAVEIVGVSVAKFPSVIAAPIIEQSADVGSESFVLHVLTIDQIEVEVKRP